MKIINLKKNIRQQRIQQLQQACVKVDRVLNQTLQSSSSRLPRASLHDSSHTTRFDYVDDISFKKRVNFQTK